MWCVYFVSLAFFWKIWSNWVKVKYFSVGMAWKMPLPLLGNVISFSAFLFILLKTKLDFDHKKHEHLNWRLIVSYIYTVSQCKNKFSFTELCHEKTTLDKYILNAAKNCSFSVAFECTQTAVQLEIHLLSPLSYIETSYANATSHTWVLLLKTRSLQTHNSYRWTSTPTPMQYLCCCIFHFKF